MDVSSFLMILGYVMQVRKFLNVLTQILFGLRKIRIKQMLHKIITILASLSILISWSGGWFQLGHYKGYNEAKVEIEGKYHKAQLEALQASNQKQNEVNQGIQSLAKVTEVKKTQQSTLKEKTNASTIEIIKAPMYSECIIPTDGLLLSSSTVTALNSIRHSGKPNGEVP
jgi:hypothetical protein